MKNFVLFGGSRLLPQAFVSVVAVAVRLAARNDYGISTGCARGADQFALEAAVSHGADVRLACIGTPDGDGFWTGSADIRILNAAKSRGADVTWQAGGNGSIPFRARLLRRSIKALEGCCSAIFFVSSPHSGGSMAVAREAIKAGQRVTMVCCGFEGPPVELDATGAWVSHPTNWGENINGWRWMPTQLELF